MAEIKPQSQKYEYTFKWIVLRFIVQSIPKLWFTIIYQAHGLFWMEILLFAEIRPRQGNNKTFLFYGPNYCY
jgi:hypothetical protein